MANFIATSSSPPPDDKTPFCGIADVADSSLGTRALVAISSTARSRVFGHSQCSEPFYRDQLASDIHTEPSTSATERKAMLELLKRFEQDSPDDPFSRPEESDDDEDPADDLDRRLAGIDLGSASADNIWAALTPEERSRFTRAVQDPTSELTKTLLTSPDLTDDIPAPWWTSSPTTPAVAPRRAQPPDLIIIPKSLLAAPPRPPSSPAPAFPLAYNLVAILIAYAYASRHLSACPLASSASDARALVSRLVPFLVAQDDKTRFPGIESASTDVFSRFGAGTITPSAFALLLRDAATLLRPPLVAEGDEGALALRALSDLHDLFTPRAPRTAAKIVFYAAQMQRASAPHLRAVTADAERWAGKLELESQSRPGPAAVDVVVGGPPFGGDTREKPRIVEGASESD
ncbi:hypothetical protein EDB89DRAFT_2139871 [Lactarius sanguifluus]|nr:hypothetical protein EDB89DRAFT_2139871 [Lactarius sanguifluus]